LFVAIVDPLGYYLMRDNGPLQLRDELRKFDFEQQIQGSNVYHVVMFWSHLLPPGIRGVIDILAITPGRRRDTT